MIRLIVSDVDGTLVPDSASSINPEYYEVIRALHEKGITVVIASGRQYASIRRMFEPVADLLWFIAEGGSMMIHGEEWIIPKVIPQEWVLEFMQDVHQIPDMDCMLAGARSAYAPVENSRMFRWVQESYRMDIRATGGWDCAPQEDITKIAVYHPEHSDALCQRWLIPKWKDRFCSANSGICWVDFLLPGINKGTALRQICERLNIPKEQTIGFGDNLNDLELFEAVEFGVAVSSAREGLKEKADKIIPNFEQDGVLEEWKSILQAAESGM